MLVVLQWIGIVLLLLLVLALIALFLPVSLVVNYDTANQEKTAYLRWFLLKFDLLKPRRGKTAARRQRKAPPEEEPPKKQDSSELTDGLRMVMHMLSDVKGAAAFLLRYFSIYRLRLRVVVSGDDAMSTALYYGRVNAAIYSTYAVLVRFLNISSLQIRVIPDFVHGQNDVSLDVRARLLPATAAFAAIKLLVGILCKSAAGRIKLTPKKTAASRSGEK